MPPSKIVAVGVTNENYRFDFKKLNTKKLSNKLITDPRRLPQVRAARGPQGMLMLYLHTRARCMVQVMRDVFNEAIVKEEEEEPWTIKGHGAEKIFGCDLKPGK
jgi:hypothetical protein